MIDNNITIGLHSIIKCFGKYGIFNGYKYNNKNFIRFKPFNNALNCIIRSELIEEIVFNTNRLENDNLFVVNKNYIVYIKSIKDDEKIICRFLYDIEDCMLCTNFSFSVKDINNIRKPKEKELSTLYYQIYANHDIIKHKEKYYLLESYCDNSNKGFYITDINTLDTPFIPCSDIRQIKFVTDYDERNNVEMVYNMSLMNKNMAYNRHYLPKPNTYYNLDFIDTNTENIQHFIIKTNTSNFIKKIDKQYNLHCEVLINGIWTQFIIPFNKIRFIKELNKKRNYSNFKNY